MKKVLGVFVAVLFVSVGTASAALSWDAPATDLAAYGISDGWLVLMFQDVLMDSSLNTITFDTTGSTVGGTGWEDDIFMGAAYQTTTALNRSGEVQFNTTIAAGWEETYGGASVYSVVLNAGDWLTATQSRIFDQTPQTLGATDPYQYTVSTPQNAWQSMGVIPEPGTLAFLGLGAVAMFLHRRNRK